MKTSLETQIRDQPVLVSVWCSGCGAQWSTDIAQAAKSFTDHVEHCPKRTVDTDS